MLATYQCSTCGETIETIVDESGGNEQTYTEDCTVCCRPNVLRIHIVDEDQVVIESEFEG